MSNTDSKININPSLANDNTMYCKQVKILELHSSFNNALRSTCLEVRKEYRVRQALYLELTLPFLDHILTVGFTKITLNLICS